MNYGTPRVFRQTLTQRAQQAARAGSRTVEELLREFYLARLLARVFRHDPHGWVLKGGQALLVRYPGTRHSRDVDLLYAGDQDHDQAVAALRAAADLELGDHLRFRFLDATTAGDTRIASKVRFTVYIGTTKIQVISIDLVVDHHFSSAPVTRQLPAVFDLDGIADWPTVRLYPIIDHLADKICAMLERHGPTAAVSSRYRDLVDLVLIICKEPVAGIELHAALRIEAGRRRDRGTQIILPSAFQIPDPVTWEPGYANTAAAVPDLDEFRTLTPATDLAAAFINPLLQPRPPGTWNPNQRTWTP